MLLNLIVIGVGTKSIIASHDRNILQIRDATGNLAVVLEHDLVSTIRSVDHALLGIEDALKNQKGHQPLSDSMIDEVLETYRRRLPEVDAFRLSDRHGTVRWGLDSKLRGPVSWADRPYFTEHKTSPGEKLIISEPLFSPISKKWVVTLTRSYTDANGHFAGVIRAALPAEFLQSLIGKLALGPHGTAVIRHENYALVTRHPATEGPAGQSGNRTVSEEFKAIVNSKIQSSNFHTKNAPDGFERTYAFRRLAGTPLILTVGMAPEDYLEAWREETRNTVSLMLVFFVTTLLLVGILKRYWNSQSEQAHFLTSLIEAMPIPVFYKNRDGKYLGII